MTRAQQVKYRLELWPAACVGQGWHKLSKAEQEEKRRAVTREVSGGHTDSTADLNATAECDALFRKLEQLAQPMDLNAARIDTTELARIDGERRRFIYVIAQLGFTDVYIDRVAAWDLRECQVNDWRELPVEKDHESLQPGETRTPGSPFGPGLRRVLIHLNKRRQEKEQNARRRPSLQEKLEEVNPY